MACKPKNGLGEGAEPAPIEEEHREVDHSVVGLLKQLSLPQEMSEWLTKHAEVNVVVVGKTGVGKSSLVNQFLGTDAETEKAEVAEGLAPKTTAVKGYVCVINNGATLHLYDSPGFEPKKHWDGVKAIKQPFSGKDKLKPDLLFFCVRMDSAPQKEDYDAMTSVSKAFGPKVWSNAVIVLTRANQLHTERFNPCYKDMEKYLNDHLVKGSGFPFKSGPSVKADVAAEIPKVAVGDETLQHFGDSEEATWLNELLVKSLDRCKHAAAPALLRANWFVFKMHLKCTFIARYLTKLKSQDHKVSRDVDDQADGATGRDRYAPSSGSVNDSDRVSGPI